MTSEPKGRIRQLKDPDKVAEKWYEERVVEDVLQQGDQLWEFEILEPEISDGVPGLRPVRMDLVILTQSCDLEHEKVDPILLAQMVTVSEWIEVNPADLTRLEDIRQGYDVSMYILPAWSKAPHPSGREDRVVDLSRLVTVQRAKLDAAIRDGCPRLGMRPPAREHLGQAVARTFMRIGLPLDILSYKLEKSGRQEYALDPSDLANEVLRSFGIELTGSVPIVRVARIRIETGERFFLITIRGHPQTLSGAGRSIEQAERSFLMQIGRAWLQGNVTERYPWIADVVQPL